MTATLKVRCTFDEEIIRVDIQVDILIPHRETKCKLSQSGTNQQDKLKRTTVNVK